MRMFILSRSVLMVQKSWNIAQKWAKNNVLLTHEKLMMLRADALKNKKWQFAGTMFFKNLQAFAIKAKGFWLLQQGHPKGPSIHMYVCHKKSELF